MADLTPEQLLAAKLERQKSMGSGDYTPSAPAKKANGLMQYVITAIISLVMCFLLAYSGTLPNLAKVSDFNGLKDSLNNSLTTMNTNFTTLQNSVATSIDTKVASATSDYSTKIANAQSQVDNMASIVKGINDTIGQYRAQIDTNTANNADVINKYNTLITQINDINTKITNIQATLTTYADLATRVKAIEDKINATPTPTTPNANKDIGITVSILESGALWSDYNGVSSPVSSVTDNSTYSQFKLKIVNNSGVDLTDVVIDAIVSFDSTLSANQLLSSATGWGAWHIKAPKTIDAVEVRCNPVTLAAGATKNVYFTFQSWAVDYIHGNTTSLSIINSDVQILSYSK